MGLLPLTPDGVAKKLERLYRLGNKDRKLLADIIRSEFKYYIKDNFLLNEQQTEYLANMDEAVADYYGSQCSICLNYRLPIEFIYPMTADQKNTKWMVASNNIVVGIDGNGHNEVSGSLTFTMIYKA
jgi:hypothetical protein